MDRVDIVIVGAGMAGLSAATTLCAESNLKVMLVEEKQIGSNQGIRAVFAGAIGEFGLEESILQEYTSFAFHSPLGALASFEYQKTELVGLDYSDACEILFKRAIGNGLTFLKGKALAWHPEIPDPTRPLIVDLADGHKIETEVIIDASGFSQWGARHLRIRPSPYFSICYGELLSDCVIESPCTFRFLGPNTRYGNGGGWLYPSGESLLSIGYSVVVKEKLADLTSVARGYVAAKEQFQPYADWVRKGVRERVEGGIVPVGRIGEFTSDRIVIVGDAAGQAFPWSVEGCRPCLINGRLSARVVLNAFSKGRFDKTTLSGFEREWSKSNRERFWRTASVADLTWARSEQEWNRLIRFSQRMSPQQQLINLRDNHASLFQQLYAVGGYGRRQFVKRMRESWQSLHR